MFPSTFRPEPRCHVCRDEPIRVQVNEMLATGSSLAGIVRALAAHGYDVSLDSVRNHAKLHFPAQNVAGATYREIIERRAAQCEIDFENGVATALTPIAYMEAMMVKGFQNLVRDDTEVSPEMGFKAAEKLHKAIGGTEDTGAKILELRVQVGRLIEGVRSAVPEEYWPAIAAMLEGPGPGRLDVPGSEPGEPGESYDPTDEVIVVPIDPGEGDDDF